MNTQVSAIESITPQTKGFQLALWLAVLTIVYNLAEGIISVWFGTTDEALALFGFGVDSFIETISATGVFAMVLRIRKNSSVHSDHYEKTALRITGWGFYVLSVSLALAAVISLLQNHKPLTTLPGVIIAIISIGTMWLLVYYKKKSARLLNSDAVMADANCNLVCIYMSLVLLLSSLLYSTTGFGGFDALGAGGLVWFSVKEGRESLAKAQGKACCCND